MKPLRVALVVKASPSTIERDCRNMGYWSYAVPEFTWKHFQVTGDEYNAAIFSDDFDLIFQEDSGPFRYTNRKLPFVYLTIDSTLSDAHYETRLKRASTADLVLVDHDQLERFPRSRRLAYCVNDRIFKPLDKTLDVTFHCSTGAHKGMPGGVEREKLRQILDGICRERNWSYRSGGVDLMSYAVAMGHSKIVVNWPRTRINRPHRVFDAMACGACLLTGPLPAVDGDYRIQTEQYTEFENLDILPGLIHHLLDLNLWQGVARDGHKLVMEHHTWAIRARELRELLARELGL